jgi:hypothetical protein
MLAAMYHRHGPKASPIMPEYHTSARPSFFLDSTKASRKTDTPIIAPNIDSQGKFHASEANLSAKNTGKAMTKAKRGTAPVFMSITATAAEKSINRLFRRAPKSIRTFYYTTPKKCKQNLVKKNYFLKKCKKLRNASFKNVTESYGCLI